LDTLQLRQAHWSGPRAWILGFVVGAALTLATFSVVRDYEDNRTSAEFQAAAVERTDVLAGDIDHALGVLRALGAYYDTAATLDRAAFRRLTLSFERQGSPIQALEWIPRVPQAQRAALVRAAHADGYPAFDIKERDAQGAMVGAGARAEYFPVTYVEPYLGNEKALGFDLASNPARRAALDQAMITAQLTATSRITLVQERADRYGFLAFRPVYQGGGVPADLDGRVAGLRGFVLGVFRIDDIVALGNKDGNATVRLVLLDEDAPKGAHLLYPKGLEVDTAAALPARLRFEKSLPVAGRAWKVVALPSDGAFRPNRGASSAIVILGLLLSGLFAAYLKQMRRRQRATERAVETGSRDLQHERNFNNAIFSSAGAVIIVVDKEARVVRFNNAAQDLTGLSFDEVRDQPYGWERFMPMEFRSQGREVFAQFASGNSPRRLQLALIDSRGKTRMMDWSNSVLLDDNGEPQYLVSIGVDITRQKRLEEQARQQEEWLRAIIEHLGEGVYTLDSQGKLNYINGQGAQMLGWSPAELVGRQVHDLIHHHRRDGSPLPSADCPIYQALHANDIYRSNEETFFHRDGTALPVKVSGAPLLREGVPYGSVVLFSDMRRENMLQRRLVEAKEAAEAAAQLKADFLSTMSHEIRTPLNGVMGMADLLLDTPLGAEQQEFVGIIKTSADALRSIIDDILDFSKIEAGRLDLDHSDFSLRRVLRNSMQILGAKARESGLELVKIVDPRLPESFNGDPSRIRQILLNFLSNAIKFTPQGQVHISAELAEERVGAGPWWVRLSVRDGGIGITPEAQARLFQAFSQADSSTTRKYGGTGLGLAISKRLAEAMGGQIGVNSAPGQGSTFWVRLPLQPAQSAMEPPRFDDGAAYEVLAPPASDAGTTVPAARLPLLLAEDNPVNQRVATLVLRKLGYEIVIVENGRDAVEAAVTGCYAGVLMDCQMPIMDGFEAAAAIRRAEQGGGGHLPIIAMTANAIEGDRERCIAAGMDDYVSKPINADRLRDVLAIWTAPARPAHLAQASDQPAPPPVDLTRLLDLFEGDQAAVIDLLATFRESMERIRDSLAPAVSAHEARIVDLAHETRGMAGNLGAETLAALATRFEAAAAHHEWDTVDSLSGPVDREIERVLAFVDDYIKA